MKAQTEQLEGPELEKAYEKLVVYSALDNRLRLKAFFLIARKPGISFNEIRTNLKIEKGHLAYHLSVLKASGLATFTYQRKGRTTSRYDLTERGKEMLRELTEEAREKHSKRNRYFAMNRARHRGAYRKPRTSPKLPMLEGRPSQPVSHP